MASFLKLSMHVSWLLVSCMFLLQWIGCNTKPKPETKPTPTVQINECKPYFQYDKVDHYFLNIDEQEAMNLERGSVRERKLNELLIQNIPDTLSDIAILNDLESLGFIRREMPKDNFPKLDEVFCERKHDGGVDYACIAIYRDIFVFRRDGKIIGVAKICFSCYQSIIIGTTRHTDDFGQSGDYDKLFRMVHPEIKLSH